MKQRSCKRTRGHKVRNGSNLRFSTWGLSRLTLTPLINSVCSLLCICERQSTMALQREDLKQMCVKIRNLQLQCICGDVVDPSGVPYHEWLEKLNSSQTSICRAQIHYRMHPLSHHLPTGHRHDYRTVVSDAGGSRWEVVVNVQRHGCGHTHPLSLSWPPSWERGNLEA